VATGRLNYEQPLEVGDRIEIGGQHGIMSTIELVLRERDLRLVVQLLRDRG
jgi:small-conductance mechanosensitive channel